MLNITTEPTRPNAQAETAPPKKASLKRYVLEKLRTWVNSLLEAERDEFLGRGRHQPLDPAHDNYRNGYRPRRVNLFGLGKVELRVPRDRKGEFESHFRVRIKGHVSVQSFCAVLGVTEENERFEVLALIMGDRERADLWEGVLQDLAGRGLHLEAVELGIMDGLPGLEETFKKFFLEPRRNAARSTPKPTPAGGCGRRNGSSSRRA